MREISESRIKAHARVRFRSEYDYALFEYYRSAKVLAFLEEAGIALGGRVLDCGCGGGGMPLSLAEHSVASVGIDPLDRFGQAGVRLGRERHLGNLHFVRADGCALPFESGSFDLVLSHAVIEHVAEPDRYLAECRRVLAPGGRLYLQTAPYLSLAGAHLPRLRIPVPIHWLVGRSLAFRLFRWLARSAPWTLREQGDENSFVRDARRGIDKQDDLLEKVRVVRLRRQIANAGFDVVQESLTPSGSVRTLPAIATRWLRDNRFTQDLILNNIEYVLSAARTSTAPR